MPAPTRHSQQFRHRAEVAARADTMKLSRAIVVVILMHVVAVGGVLAFSLLHEGEGGGKKMKEEGGRKKEEPAKLARKTAPTQGMDAPAPKPAPVATLPIPALARPAAGPADPLENEALAILQGGGSPVAAKSTPPATRPVAVSAKLTAKPDVRPANNSARSKKEEAKPRQ